jgi:hypothetical protein
MVSEQAACPIDTALVLMKARATVVSQTLDEIAVAVLGRTIRFGDEARTPTPGNPA